jgi:hypothetical protein
MNFSLSTRHSDVNWTELAQEAIYSEVINFTVTHCTFTSLTSVLQCSPSLTAINCVKYVKITTVECHHLHVIPRFDVRSGVRRTQLLNSRLCQ